MSSVNVLESTLETNRKLWKLYQYAKKLELTDENWNNLVMVLLVFWRDCHDPTTDVFAEPLVQTVCTRGELFARGSC